MKSLDHYITLCIHSVTGLETQSLIHTHTHTHTRTHTHTHTHIYIYIDAANRPKVLVLIEQKPKKK